MLKALEDIQVFFKWQYLEESPGAKDKRVQQGSFLCYKATYKLYWVPDIVQAKVI